MKLQKITLTLAAVSALALAACSSEEATTPDPTDSVTQSAASAEPTEDATTQTPTPEDSASPAGSESAQAPNAATEPGTVEDAAAARDAALAQVEAEHGAQGIVLAQDLDDNRSEWDVDVLLVDTVHEVKVNTAESTARIDSTEKADNEDLDVATLEFTIEMAIESALQNTPGIIDDAQWDDDPNAWQIDVETADGKDVELHFDAAGNLVKG